MADVEICIGCNKEMSPIFDFPDFTRKTKYACITPDCKFNVFEVWKKNVGAGLEI